MEKVIEETKPEKIFDNITWYFMELVRYVVVFAPEDSLSRKYYLEDLNKLYTTLIRNCRYFLTKLYKEKIDNIFSDEVETSSKVSEEIGYIMKTFKNEKTLLPEGKESENL